MTLASNNKVQQKGKKIHISNPSFTASFYYSPVKKRQNKHPIQSNIPEYFFSPNGDGVKDYIRIMYQTSSAMLDLSLNYQFYITNANQSTVYSIAKVKNTHFLWDGNSLQKEIVPDGVYYAYLQKSQNQSTAFPIAKITVDTQLLLSQPSQPLQPLQPLQPSPLFSNSSLDFNVSSYVPNSPLLRSFSHQVSYTINRTKIYTNEQNKYFSITITTQEELSHVHCTIYNSNNNVAFSKKVFFQGKRKVKIHWKPFLSAAQNGIYKLNITVNDKAGNRAALSKKQLYILLPQDSIFMLVSKQSISPLELFYTGIGITIQNIPIDNLSYWLQLVNSQRQVLFEKQLDNKSSNAFTYKSNTIFKNGIIYVRLMQKKTNKKNTNSFKIYSYRCL